MRHARITSAGFDRVSEFAQAHEQQCTGEMFRRIIPMLLKLAMLSAAGAPQAFSLTGDLIVDRPDVEHAAVVATRWSRFASAFSEKIGQTSHMKTREGGDRES